MLNESRCHSGEPTLNRAASAFHGMVPTFLIRKVSASVYHAGSSTGRVYAISSASGIVALPVFGFFIIPQFVLTLPSIAIGLVVESLPFVKLIARK